MTDLELHPEALRDYEEAYDWYARQSLRAAEGFDGELRETLAKLMLDASLGIEIDAVHRFYRLKRYPYYLVFRIDPDRIWVVAVSHNRRDPSYWRGR